MRIINAIRFLITFIWIAILSFFICLIYGTETVFKVLQKNGIILTNDEKLRNGEK